MLNHSISVATCQDYQQNSDLEYKWMYDQEAVAINLTLYSASISQWKPRFPSACHRRSTKEQLLTRSLYYLDGDASLIALHPGAPSALYWPDNSYCLMYDISTGNFTSAVLCPPLSQPTLRAYLYSVLAFVSFLSLTALILILNIVKVGSHKNVNRKILLHYCCCLMVALVIAFVKWWSILFHRDYYFCVLIDVAVHYFLLSLFTWSNVMCIHIWFTFRSLKTSLSLEGDHGERALVFYCLYAYSLPGLIVFAGIVLEYSPGIPSSMRHDLGAITCFFELKNMPFMVLVFSPSFLLLVTNALLFTRTSVYLYGQRNVSMSASENHNKITFVLFLRLFILMGVSWFGEIWSWPLQTYLEGAIPEQVFYITDCINCLQGLFIFVIYITSNNFQQIHAKQILQDIVCACCKYENKEGFKARYFRRRSGSFKTPSVRLTRWTTLDSRADIQEAT